VAWEPGQVTEIHDHLAWCSFIVLEGAGAGTVSGTGRGHRAGIGERQRPAVSVSGAAPHDDIHRVCNTGDTAAITLHVHGPGLNRGVSVAEMARDR
jgi:3-mercaptopropionate dioxygenase